jgi:hypothetical protein
MNGYDYCYALTTKLTVPFEGERYHCHAKSLSLRFTLCIKNNVYEIPFYFDG